MKNLLDYSYARIELDNYLSSFKSNRIKALSSINNQVIIEDINFDEACIVINKLISNLKFDNIHKSEFDTSTSRNEY